VCARKPKELRPIESVAELIGACYECGLFVQVRMPIHDSGEPHECQSCGELLEVYLSLRAARLVEEEA
jgi:hypothetical protein